MPSGFKILEDYGLAAKALCDQQALYARVAKSHKRSMKLMKRYTAALPFLVDVIAPVPQGQPRESAKLRKRRAYKTSLETVKTYEKFIEGEEERLNEKLPPGRSFRARVYAMPIDAQHVSTMKWVTAQYKLAIPIALREFEKTFAALGRSSEKLPISFLEYHEKGPAYDAACEDLPEKDVRRLTAETFKKLSRRYWLDTAPSSRR